MAKALTAPLALKVDDLIDGVHKAMVWVHGEKGRIGGLRRQADGSQLGAVGVEPISVDAFTRTAFRGVGADVYEILGLVLARRARPSANSREASREEHECQQGCDRL